MNPLKYLVLLLFWTGLVLGCAVPGPQFIDLAYTGRSQDTTNGSVGISRFLDLRKGQDKGNLGFRTLNTHAKEIYLVQGLDLGTTLTDFTQVFLEKKGLGVTQAQAWTPTLEGLSKAEAKTEYLLSGQINTFECRAVKKGAVTQMTLEIDLTFFLATPRTKTLKTIPVNLTLDHTDIHFTRNKLESFFNETMAEVLDRALTFDQDSNPV